MRILILGGTTEAAGLARALSGRDVITSLAGRTESPAALPGRVRVGGFGGAPGLADYLRAEAIDRVIDATHPFAARISANAAQACAATGVPRLMLVRPAWPRRPDDLWHPVATVDEAARRLPSLGRRAFLTVGIGESGAFATVAGVHFVVRLIAPRMLPLADYQVVAGKGPFDPAAETALLRSHRIDVMVTKHSGGAATYGKIAAARELGLPVLMVARPPMPEGAAVDSVAAATEWLRQRV